jgi:hypothetical protein
MGTKIVTIYGFASIGVMLVMLTLMWFKIVPQSYYLPFFFIALALLISRIILRLIMTRQEKRSRATEIHNETP